MHACYNIIENKKHASRNPSIITISLLFRLNLSFYLHFLLHCLLLFLISKKSSTSKLNNMIRIGCSEFYNDYLQTIDQVISQIYIIFICIILQTITDLLRNILIIVTFSFIHENSVRGLLCIPSFLLKFLSFLVTWIRTKCVNLFLSPSLFLSSFTTIM